MRRALHVIWRVVKPLGEVVLALIVLLAAVLIPTLSGSAGSVENNLKGVVLPATATTGPIPGDQSLFDQETACIKRYAADPANNYVGYFPAIGAPEHTDNIRSGVQPCGDFTGDFGGDNQVFRYQSETTYDQINLVVFDGPNGAYLQAAGTGPPSTGQYVSKFDPSTGKEMWRTYLANVNVSGQWLAFGSMAVAEDGMIVNAAGHTFYRLDPDTGAVLASKPQPIVGSPAKDANFDGMIVAPDEQGTLLIKSQNRPSGCPTQGNFALSTCVSEYGSSPDSTVVAVDPDTLENLDAVKLDQAVTARGVATEHDGQIYIYLNGAKSLARVIWDPDTETLTQDKSWEPKVILKGQTGGASPSILGDWVIANSNAIPSKETPQCDFAVNQDDPSDIHRICPWGKTFPTESGATESDVLGSPGVDADNSLIFVNDVTAKGVYAIRLDQRTGEMKIAWSRPDWWSTDYFSMVGPASKRVLTSQNLNPETSASDIPGYAYTESVLWADEATGKTIAESEQSPSTALGSLVNVGYGGRFYTMGNDGSLFIYQVEPKS